ncbi:6-phosphofructo-2-kinase fructose-2,6-bisphosphatase-like isoform X2 [Micractinium conductrix]|uniref:6-phosphofructo-2-kinase fructose-2,6-bisphosphatase-like isoform X2 n=1 Tax=Micractinium conductrix TaxID=554055 RepID=A0A2P6V9R6_9CHLO|nr:6-phosphofructo-2-kinase fructose-2,6-bisphosphatase-like isoform X2 [Micractinium conductrix]|eukprot:PSC70832.1 6-phosphofructo-2-kinase fructose-2,6-bisphosphatase-like isoform X2 [Micractinium conductrix]
MASVRSAGGAFLQPPRATPQAAATAAVRVPRPHTRPLLRAQATGFGDGQSTERASSPQRRSPSAGRGGRGRGRGGSAGGRSGGGRVRQPGDKPASEKQRLNKAIASAGVASRRAADDLISQGKVTVNGRVVTELATQVDLRRDKVSVSGRDISAAAAAGSQRKFYFALNKPKGYICSNKSEHDDGGEGRLVIDLFDEWLAGWRQRAARRSHEGGAPAGLPPRLFTVGRLDVQSVGLIFVTNDGDWAHKVMHPSSGITKEYSVTLNRKPRPQELEAVGAGCAMDGVFVQPVAVARDDTDPGKPNRMRIVVAEGRNREVRNLVEAAGLEVKTLRRVRIGGYRLPRGTAFGQFVELRPQEAAAGAMWEYWRHKLSKDKNSGRLLDGAPSPSAPVERVGVTEVPTAEQEYYDAAAAAGRGDASTAHIYFKDLKLLAHDEDSEDEEGVEGGPGSMGASAGNLAGLEAQPGASYTSLNRLYSARGPGARLRRKRVDRQKLIVCLVGLPARGKTFLCNKLMCYLNWLGHPTRHFNVGQYRRRVKGAEHQDAEFFDPRNPVGQAARHHALSMALDDMEAWLETDSAQVAVLDATNSTEERRNHLRSRFHGKWQYLFIESICNDMEVLENNYRLKMMYSPDYKGVDTEQALADFRTRIRKYELGYETIMDRALHYIKLIDMVTGRGYMDVNRISGYLPGKMVFFLMQVCRAGVGRPRKIWLTRHGESQFNTMGKIGGNSSLSKRGQMYAELLPDILASRVPKTADGQTYPMAVWTSTLQRTIITASGLPYPKVQWKALDEIQAGTCDGMTYEEVAEVMPGEFAERRKDKLRYRYPSGESYMDVIQRLEPVVTEAEREKECVCIVSHQAVLRALYGYFMNQPLESVPRIDIPLHTLMELTPRADGTMAEVRFIVDVDKAIADAEAAMAEHAAAMARDDSATSSLSSSPEKSVGVHFDLSSGLGGGAGGTSGSEGRPMFKRSLSMAELAAAELVREEEVQLRHQESAEPAVLEAAVRAEEDSEKAGYRHTT